MSCRVVSCRVRAVATAAAACNLAREARSLPLSKAPQPRPLPPRASWLCSAPRLPLPQHEDRTLAWPLIGTISQGTTAALVLSAPGLHVRPVAGLPLGHCSGAANGHAILPRSRWAKRDAARRVVRDVLSDDGARGLDEPCPVGPAIAALTQTQRQGSRFGRLAQPSTASLVHLVERSRRPAAGGGGKRS